MEMRCKHVSSYTQMNKGKSFLLESTHGYFTGIFAYFIPLQFQDADTVEWTNSKCDLQLEAGEAEFQAGPWMEANGVIFALLGILTMSRIQAIITLIFELPI